MKKLILAITLLLAKDLFATHDGDYLVYHMRTYLQGPWADGNNRPEPELVYLMPVMYSGFFGTVPEQIPEAILDKLQTFAPGRYTWFSHLSVDGDTVQLYGSDPGTYKNWVMAELAASFSANGYVVKLPVGAGGRILTFEDVAFPRFEFVSTLTIEPIEEDPSDSLATSDLPNAGQVTTEVKSSRSYWLIISVGLNIALLLLLVYRRMGKRNR